MAKFLWREDVVTKWQECKCGHGDDVFSETHSHAPWPISFGAAACGVTRRGIRPSSIEFDRLDFEAIAANPEFSARWLAKVMEALRQDGQ